MHVALPVRVALMCVMSGLVDVGAARETIDETSIAERAVATLTIAGYPDFLAADDDAVWVTNEGRVEKLGLGEPQPVVTAAMPEPCGAMTVAFNAVWVADCKDAAVYRLNRYDGSVIAIIRSGLADRQGELSLAAGAGSIWVLSDADGVLSRIDPRSNTVSARIKVAPQSYAAVFGFGAIWITNTNEADGGGNGAVQRIDPATNRVTATIGVGPTPRFLAAGEGGVWTLNQGDGTVTRIDPRLNSAVATIEAGVPGSGGDIDAGGGRVWVRAKKVLLSEIDPALNRVVACYGPPAGSGAVRVAKGAVWVTAHDTNTVWAMRVSK